MVWCNHFHVWSRELIRYRRPKQSRQSFCIPPCADNLKRNIQITRDKRYMYVAVTSYLVHVSRHEVFLLEHLKIVTVMNVHQNWSMHSRIRNEYLKHWILMLYELRVVGESRGGLWIHARGYLSSQHKVQLTRHMITQRNSLYVLFIIRLPSRSAVSGS